MPKSLALLFALLALAPAPPGRAEEAARGLFPGGTDVFFRSEKDGREVWSRGTVLEHRSDCAPEGPSGPCYLIRPRPESKAPPKLRPPAEVELAADLGKRLGKAKLSPGEKAYQLRGDRFSPCEIVEWNEHCVEVEALGSGLRQAVHPSGAASLHLPLEKPPAKLAKGDRVVVRFAEQSWHRGRVERVSGAKVWVRLTGLEDMEPLSIQDRRTGVRAVPTQSLTTPQFEGLKAWDRFWKLDPEERSWEEVRVVATRRPCYLVTLSGKRLGALLEEVVPALALDPPPSR